MKAFDKNKKITLTALAILLSSLVVLPVSAEASMVLNDASDLIQGKEVIVTLAPDISKTKTGKDKLTDEVIEDPAMGIDLNDVKAALDSKNYIDFTKILTDASVSKVITEAQFNLIVEAYVKAKAGSLQDAQKILKDNNLDQMLYGFVIGQHMQLTDADKTAIKEAEELLKKGKTEEAKSIIAAAGLPKHATTGSKNIVKNDEIKTSLQKAKQLRSQGLPDQAKQVLKDSGIPEKAVIKLEKEFDKESPQKDKKSLIDIFKKFFNFSKK